MANGDTSLQKSIEYIQEWLRINAENQRAVKTLTDILDVLLWAKETIDRIPSAERSEAQARTFQVLFAGTYDSLVQFLPRALPVDLAGLERVTSTATSITSFGVIDALGSIVFEDSKTWVVQRVDSFAKMQERHHAIERLKSLLSCLESAHSHPPNVLEEYDLVIDKALYYMGSEIDKAVSAGIAMRNLLEHVKGKLFVLAGEPERGSMDWPLMAQRLGISFLLSIERQILLKEEENWKDLHAKLTAVAKNTGEGDIRTLAIKLIVHLSTVLNLVDLSGHGSPVK
jgi:hypothetical protein